MTAEGAANEVIVKTQEKRVGLGETGGVGAADERSGGREERECRLGCRMVLVSEYLSRCVAVAFWRWTGAVTNSPCRTVEQTHSVRRVSSAPTRRESREISSSRTTSVWAHGHT
eukprot:6201640-Pleurochrysis_carterae.AAC.2